MEILMMYMDMIARQICIGGGIYNCHSLSLIIMKTGSARLGGNYVIERSLKIDRSDH